MANFRLLLWIPFMAIIFSLDLAAQPLQFFDVKDSLPLKALNVHSTSDAGWITLANAPDSTIQLIKYNYCGKKVYTKKFKIDTFDLFAMNTTRFPGGSQSDTILLAEVFTKGAESGIHLLEIHPFTGSVLLSTTISIPNQKVYLNPVVHATNDLQARYISFNAGPDSSDLSGYLIRTDQNFSQQLLSKLDSAHLIRDVHVFNNNQIFLALDSNVVAGIDPGFNVLFTYHLDSQFVHIDRGIVTGNSSVVLAGNYFTISSANNLCLVELDQEGVIEEQTTLAYPYDPSLEPRVVSYRPRGGNQRQFLTSFAHQVNGNLSSPAGAKYDSRLANTANNSLLKSITADKVSNLAIDYSEIEENVIMTGNFTDTLRFFNAKLATDLKINDAKCTSEDMEIIARTIVEKFEQDTFTGLKFISLPMVNNNSSIFPKMFDLELKRSCTYYDFKQGATKVMGCVGDSNTILAIPVKYANLDFQNPFVKYLWSPDPDTKIPNTTYDTLITIPNIALTITSSYCDEAASLTYNIEELPCVDFPNVFAPGSETLINKDFNPVYKDNNLNKIRSVEFDIYNRWGKKVFSTTNPAATWDGNIDGNPAPMESYLYTLTIFYLNNQVRTQKGVFSLIR
ncbi:MAG: gliding motility-associated C-terminal domain-containing protein [Saprospiraceae bacterium]|nr:gliding motility-associated C-terminal domain-containing protein [Saprospiraceae bacterium]